MKLHETEPRDWWLEAGIQQGNLWHDNVKLSL